MTHSSPQNYPEWLITAANLGFAGAVPPHAGIDRESAESPGNEIIALEWNQEAATERFFENAICKGLLFKSPQRWFDLRSLQRKARTHRWRILGIYGVLTGYYSCHVCLGPGRKNDMLRFCIDLRTVSGYKNKVKHYLKKALIAVGAGSRLFEYYLVYMEKMTPNDR